MKSASDPRHQKRREIVKLLFAEEFTHQDNLSDIATKILRQKDKIDKKILKAAPAWPIDKLNRIDLGVLRLAIFELGQKETPPKVIIDEAVELAKEFGSENSASFVNGVLGSVYKEIDSEKQEKKTSICQTH
jgi:N utilization substance protein B